MGGFNLLGVMPVCSSHTSRDEVLLAPRECPPMHFLRGQVGSGESMTADFERDPQAPTCTPSKHLSTMPPGLSADAAGRPVFSCLT